MIGPVPRKYNQISSAILTVPTPEIGLVSTVAEQVWYPLKRLGWFCRLYWSTHMSLNSIRKQIQLSKSHISIQGFYLEAILINIFIQHCKNSPGFPQDILAQVALSIWQVWASPRSDLTSNAWTQFQCKTCYRYQHTKLRFRPQHYPSVLALWCQM